MNLGTKIYTLLFGKYVGTDEFGNRYYQSKTGGVQLKRWVMYKNTVEPSLVPPEWHGWLHKTIDEIPSPTKIKPYKWQKKHIPNLTGTASAYYPPGHVLSGGKRKKATGDYIAWAPKNS